MDLLKNAAVIWCADAPEKPDQYRIFRKKFTLPESSGKKICLDISADSTFAVWINGRRCPGGQFSDYPGDRTCASLDISGFVRPGSNLIAVEVHYIGKDFLTYITGPAYLCAAVHDGTTVFTATDHTWKWLVSPDMVSGLCCPVTSQLGFVFCRDARKSIPWQDPRYDDSEWNDAVEISSTSGWKMNPRPVPQLNELPRRDVFFAQCGLLKRPREESTFALTAFGDFLAPKRIREFFTEYDRSQMSSEFFRERMKMSGSHAFDYLVRPASPGEAADGYYLVLDLDRETVGYLSLELYAPAGTVVDICHGEHLNDGRVRCAVGNRNFADRLICREGWNGLFYPHRRFGCRYLELHITGAGAGEIRLRYAGLVPVELPLPTESEFITEDRLLDRINRVSADTLKLCMHEHYEDCPWREQGLYAYDSRNQMLYGYYLWGNYDFAGASLDLLGKSFDGERYLSLTAPGSHHKTIPLFTMVWIAALYDNFLHSGSFRTAGRWLGQADRILDRALSEPVESCPDLYHPGADGRVWNFCEWNGELCSLDVQPQLPYNIYLHEALRAAARLHLAEGNRDRAAFLNRTAEKLGAAAERVFFNSRTGYYDAAAGSAGGQGYEHIQTVMLAAGLVPEEKKPRLLDLFREETLAGIDLSALLYLIRGLTELGPGGRRLLPEYLRRLFEPQVLSGATSLRETRYDGNDFDNGGSLCHGWGSIMPYYCRHVVLGVTPLEPGFRRFEVKPYSAGLTHASGTVPTPSGPVRVGWTRGPDGLHVHVAHPAVLACSPAEWPEEPVAEWRIETVS